MWFDKEALIESVAALADDADALCTAIKRLLIEVRKIDGVESAEHLADVPGELEAALRLADRAYEMLEAAESSATNAEGGK